jgi:hypothetical protein
MRILISLLSLFSFVVAYSQAQVPEATELYIDLKKVTPGEGNLPPSDAIVLFDGTNLDQWQKPQLNMGAGMKEMKERIPKLDPKWSGDPAKWNVSDGILTVEPGSGNIATKQSFGDVQLHIEWLAPAAEGKKGQMYSNSGVFFMSMYEVQILNSFENPTYNNGQAASVYKQHIPLVNASRPTENWQEYDIIFNAPRFSESGRMIQPAEITVFHNGVLVQNGVELLGPTCYIGQSYYVPHTDKLPIVLQDHGDPMQFRNIWIREL